MSVISRISISRIVITVAAALVVAITTWAALPETTPLRVDSVARTAPSSVLLDCPDLAFGYTGDCARVLQETLNAAGASPPLPEDGDFGRQTEAAVKAEQAEAGLDPDGVAGRRTKEHLIEVTAQGAVAPPAPADPPVDENQETPDSVPDRRPTSAEGEITALYLHGLNRDPDAGSFTKHAGEAQRDCRWGVLKSSYSIMTAPEARNVWRNDPQALAEMLHASLLNRPADPGELQAYTGAIRDRGLESVTVSTLASDEYNRRLDRICPSGGTARMRTSAEAQAFAVDELWPRAENLAIACGVTTGLQKVLASLRNKKLPLAQAVGIAAHVTNKLADKAKLNRECDAAAAYAKAALAIFVTIEGERLNPVFTQTYVGGAAIFGGHRLFIIRVGANPTTWSEYSGRAI
jgi:peptidoglycan hydrolase-like protein with peptidoglycan-binding domain